MGMSTHLLGFKEPDEKWKAMEAVRDSCKAAGINPPEEVSKYFEWDTPDDRGVEVKVECTDCCQELGDDHRSGFEVELRKLPDDLTYIRFYNSD
jgi:hypothetical protein